MTQKQLEKELKEAREEIKRLTDELKCARCIKGQPCQMPYYPTAVVYPYVEPYQPWGWPSTTTTKTFTASDTFVVGNGEPS